MTVDDFAVEEAESARLNKSISFAASLLSTRLDSFVNASFICWLFCVIGPVRPSVQDTWFDLGSFQLRSNLGATRFRWLRCYLLGLKPRPNDRNMSTQHIGTLLGATCCARLATMLCRVATCWVLLAQVWRWSNLSQQHPTYRKATQHGGQTLAACSAQQCCVMLCWHVAIVWPGLNILLRNLRRINGWNITNQGNQIFVL